MDTLVYLGVGIAIVAMGFMLYDMFDKTATKKDNKKPKK